MIAELILIEDSAETGKDAIALMMEVEATGGAIVILAMLRVVALVQFLAMIGKFALEVQAGKLIQVTLIKAANAKEVPAGTQQQSQQRGEFDTPAAEQARLPGLIFEKQRFLKPHHRFHESTVVLVTGKQTHQAIPVFQIVIHSPVEQA